MNRMVGPLLLAWTMGASVPASAQHSSLTGVATAGRPHANAPRGTGAAAGAVGDADGSRKRAAKAAQSAALIAQQSSLEHALKFTETQLRTTTKAVQREEMQVKAGRSPREGLARLRAEGRAL